MPELRSVQRITGWNAGIQKAGLAQPAGARDTVYKAGALFMAAMLAQQIRHVLVAA